MNRSVIGTTESHVCKIMGQKGFPTNTCISSLCWFVFTNCKRDQSRFLYKMSKVAGLMGTIVPADQ